MYAAAPGSAAASTFICHGPPVSQPVQRPSMAACDRPAYVLRMVHRPMSLADVDETLALLPAQVSTDAAERAAIARAVARLAAARARRAKRPDGGPGAAARPAHPGLGASILLSPAQAQAQHLDAEPQASLARRVYA